MSRPSHDLITLIIFGVKSTDFETPHYATFSLLGPNILLSTLVLKHPQSVFFPKGERPSFRPISNKRQTYLIFAFLTEYGDTKRSVIHFANRSSYPTVSHVLKRFI